MRRLTLLFFILTGLQTSQASLYHVEIEFDNLLVADPYQTGPNYSNLSGVTPDTSTMKLVFTLDKDGPATIINQTFDVSNFVSYTLSQSSTGFFESATAADITGAGIDLDSTGIASGSFIPSTFNVATDSSGNWSPTSTLLLNFHNFYTILDQSTPIAGDTYTSFTAPADPADIVGLRSAYDLELIPVGGSLVISKWDGARIPQWVQNPTTPLTTQATFSIVAVPEPSSIFFLLASFPLIYRRSR